MQPWLTVHCPKGLCNRLKVLVSGHAIAQATGRRFRMVWPRTEACGASFQELFANRYPVETVAEEAVAGLPYTAGWAGAPLPDLLTATEPDLVVGHPTWLLKPDLYPGHAAILERCETIFQALQPVAPVLDRVEAFRSQWIRTTMIGVHLRRGDFMRERPDTAGNTAGTIDQVDRYLAQYPTAHIFLATDDGAPQLADVRHRSDGVRLAFVARYGGRVAYTEPCSLDRRSPLAIQDALVDLWLLRTTDCLVGTEGSSFSQLASFGRSVPAVQVGGATPGYGRLEHVARLTGLYALLMAWEARSHTDRRPFVVVWRQISRGPRRLATRWVRGRVPNLTPRSRK